ncbi:MAG: YiiD C-terminal domain-containing protein [Gammaproteobacteria bacterium]
MNLRELETYLHEHIPLSLAMQVSVLDATPEQVVLGAPLAPNINHRETVFGGSASALTILSAWTLLHTKLTASGFKCTLVIQRNTMSYEKAVTGNFSAKATAPSAEAWKSFTRMLQRKGRARITVSSVLMQEGGDAGHFEGDFVALGAAGG